jgi:hypothetical protein
MIGEQAPVRDAGSLATALVVFTLVEMFLFYSVTASALRRDVAVIGILGVFAIALAARTRSTATVRTVAIFVTVLMLLVPLLIALSHSAVAGSN